MKVRYVKREKPQKKAAVFIQVLIKCYIQNINEHKGLYLMIVWGNREIRKNAGNVAYYCYSCHDTLVHSITETFSVGHLYLIPVTRKKFLFTEVKCLHCQKINLSDTRASNYYPSKTKNLVELIADIPQEILDEWEEEKLKYKKVIETPSILSKEERMDFMLKEFMSYEGQLAIVTENGPNIDNSAIPGCLCLIAGIMIMVLGGEAFMDSSLGKTISKETGVDGFGLGMLYVIFCGFSWVVWLMITARPRYFSKHIYPQLVASIAHLKPNIQELINIKEFLKENDQQMRYFSISKLQTAIENYNLK